MIIAVAQEQLGLLNFKATEFASGCLHYFYNKCYQGGRI